MTKDINNTLVIMFITTFYFTCSFQINETRCFDLFQVFQFIELKINR